MAGSKTKLPSKGVQSIEIGFRLIKLLHNATQGMALKDLAQAAGMSPSKAHTYLVSFRNIGLVSQNPSNSRYELGQLAGELGLSRLAQQRPVRIAERAIHLLREQKLRTSMFVSIWSERGPVIVIRDEGNDTDVPFDIRVGYHSSLFFTATGRIFLAFMHDAVTGPVLSLEKRELKGDSVTFPSQKQIADVATTIRAAGIAVVDNLLLPGMAGMAVPILDQSGRLGAVLTMIGRSGMADFVTDGNLAAAMKEAIANSQKL